MPSTIIFIAFAIEDERMRDLLKGQSLNTASPFEYVDMGVHKAYAQAEWKDRVRTRVRRSHGVLVLVSRNSLYAAGQEWEIHCAKEERKKMLGVWVYENDRTVLPGVRTVPWTWSNVADFIDGL